MFNAMFIIHRETAGCISHRSSGILPNNVAIMLCGAYSSFIFQTTLKMGTEETCYFFVCVCVCVCVCFVSHTHTHTHTRARAPPYSALVLDTWNFSAIFLYGIGIKHTELG